MFPFSATSSYRHWWLNCLRVFAGRNISYTQTARTRLVIHIMRCGRSSTCPDRYSSYAMHFRNGSHGSTACVRLIESSSENSSLRQDVTRHDKDRLARWLKPLQTCDELQSMTILQRNRRGQQIYYTATVCLLTRSVGPFYVCGNPISIGTQFI